MADEVSFCLLECSIGIIIRIYIVSARFTKLTATVARVAEVWTENDVPHRVGLPFESETTAQAGVAGIALIHTVGERTRRRDEVLSS